MNKAVVEVILKLKDMTASGLSAFQARWKAVAKVMAAVTGVVVGTVAALTKLGQQGAKMIGVQGAFARTTDNAADALERLRVASGGTITDLDLMARHNQALALGTARSTEEFARMLRVADALGDSLGIDGVEAMEKFADVMASGSQRAARALGIEIEAGMTRNQILERAEEVAGRIKGEMGEGAEAADRFWTSIKNGKDRISEMVAQAPLVAAFFNGLTVVINGAVTALEKLLKFLRLVPQDAGLAGADAAAGGGGSAMAGLGAWLSANPVTFRDMLGSGVDPEALARFRERQARSQRWRFSAFATGPIGEPGARFLGGNALPGVGGVTRPHGAALEFEDATGIVVDSLERMGDAAIEESARMSDAIIGSLRQVIANIKTRDGLFGSTLLGGVLGIGLGIVGSLIGRKREPVPVSLHDVTDRAAQQMREKGGPPLRVTTIIQKGDVEIDRIEREFYSRQGRDEVIRYSPVSGDFLRGR